MKAPDFSYEKPNSIPGILSLLEKDELECQLLAGGQSLMPMMNFRMATPKTIVDISGVSELSLITDTPKAIEIGAMVRYCELQDSDVIQKFVSMFGMNKCSIQYTKLASLIRAPFIFKSLVLANFRTNEAIFETVVLFARIGLLLA